MHYVYHTIPFGWKASAYIYHTIGMGATSYIRSLGVPCSQYIDDRHVGQLTTCRKSPKSTTAWSDFELAEAAAFIAAAVLISLGYFIGLAKSSLLPKRIVKFLGFLVDKSRYDHVRLVENSRNSFASNGRECIMYTTPYHSGGKPARTFTTLLVWGPLVTSDLWACHVVNISTTDMLDN